MATYDWPVAFYPTAMEWGNTKAIAQFQSQYSGRSQFVETGPERWVVSFSLPPRVWAEAARFEAFFERLAGGINRVRLYHRTRPVPQGSMRGTPTVQGPAVRGDTSLTIGTTVSATLKVGDLISVGGQLYKCADDCIANGAGLLVVPLVHRVRYATATGTAVLWDRPTADFIMPANGSKIGYSPFVSDPMSQLDFVEVW